MLHDQRDLAFVLAAYAMLPLLFYCLSKFEALTVDSPAETRKRLNLSVWALSTALTAMFSCPVSPLSLLVSWVMALLVAIRGGSICYLFPTPGSSVVNSLEK